VRGGEGDYGVDATYLDPEILAVDADCLAEDEQKLHQVGELPHVAEALEHAGLPRHLVSDNRRLDLLVGTLPRRHRATSLRR
jgi:hypothetical protein